MLRVSLRLPMGPLTYNNRVVTDFLWMLHSTNTMEWALTYPEARTQLIEWEEYWAKPMMANSTCTQSDGVPTSE